MENDVKLSIIIPIYKVELYLERCLQSIIEQMDDNLEVILVDDGSPDKCPEICNKYESKYSNFKVIHKENGGLASAVKEGTLASSGKHVAYVDSDDWLEIGWYKSVIKILDAHPDIDTIFYGFQRVEDGTIKVGKPYDLFEEKYYCGDEIEKIKIEYMKPGGVGPTRWNKVYKREIVNECLKYYDTRISIGEDMVFSAIATDLMKDTYIIKKPFVNYFINSGSMTQHFNMKYETSFEVLFESLEKYFGESQILYYIHYINMRTMVNALGKSDFEKKSHYLKKLMKSNKDRLKKVDRSKLSVQDRMIALLMIHSFTFILLGIGKVYRRIRR